MAKTSIWQPDQLSLLTPPDKQNLLSRPALSNRILIAEPLVGSKVIDEDRYQLTVNIKVPGQWRGPEIQRVLKLSEAWSWRGILDAATLAELEALLDAVASGEGATNSGEWRGGAS